MGVKKYTDKITTDSYFHIFNRGINGERIFSTAENYHYFLGKIKTYLSRISKVHCYCLLPNHFHLLIQTKTEKEIMNAFTEKSHINTNNIISKQFSNLFNSYAQAFNKQEKRTGKLFEQPFRRIKLTNEEYLKKIVLYIHHNPKKHEIEDDISLYPYSSYQQIKSYPKQHQHLIDWFSGFENFIQCHTSYKIG